MFQSTNNPMMAMMQAAKSGMNPMQFLQQSAGNSPQMQLLMNMVNGKNPQQLRSIAENMARERGTTVEQVAQSIGVPFRK